MKCRGQIGTSQQSTSLMSVHVDIFSLTKCYQNFFSGVVTILENYELIDMFHPKVTLLMHLNRQVCGLSIWSLNIGLPSLVYLRRPLIYAVNGGTFNDSFLQRYVNNWTKMRMAVVASNEVLAMLLVLKNGLLLTNRLQQSIY